MCRAATSEADVNEKIWGGGRSNINGFVNCASPVCMRGCNLLGGWQEDSAGGKSQ